MLGTTVLILAIALFGSVIERALARRVAIADQISRILESISDGFFSVDRSWRLNYVNHLAHQIITRFGRDTSGSLIGRSLWDVMPELRGTRFEQEYRRAMEERKPTHAEDFFTPGRLCFEAHAYPSNTGISVYFRDVSERKRSEQALEEAIRARDEFLSIASHELKTPLTTMRLQTQMRQRSLKKGDLSVFSPEKLTKSLDSDSRQLDRLTRLIDDMLDISRINTGTLTFRRANVDLCQLVKDVLERLQDQLAAIGCATHLESNGPVVGFWDGFRIEQVISNLLTNAMRYGKGKPISLSVGLTDGRATLSIRDQGVGIKEEDQERIFRRFERAVSASEISGLGLGLYIARTIAEMHGGTIRVSSMPGHGATFTVELLLSGEPEGGSAET